MRSAFTIIVMITAKFLPVVLVGILRWKDQLRRLMQINAIPT